MDKIKTRKEINSSDKWSIELVYKDVDSFNKDLKKVELEIEKLNKLSESFTENSEKFKEFFIQDEVVSRLLDKLSIYAHCKNDEDKTNSIYQEIKGKIPNVLKMDNDLVYHYINEQEELKPYKHFLDMILSKKEHILNEDIEKVLSVYQPVLSASGSTSAYLTDADLEFGIIENEKKEEIELNEANYSTLIVSEDRTLRKNAFEKLYNTYGKVKNTLTSTYSTTVNNDAITSRLRHYNSSIEMYLTPKNIPIELYNNLIKVVRNNLDVLYNYYDLKKEILNLDEFHLYDTYVKVIKDNNKKYTFDEAKDIIIDALSIYGEDYTKVLKSAFTDGWIDKYPNKGKRSGAYSTGSYDTLPYILLNYTDEYNDVSTLAHELGHSMHSYYTMKNNPYITADYPIFLAEIASTTNELLLSHYMYEKSNNKLEKLNILNEKLDLFKATIFRQTMFAEFEKNVHEYVDNKNVLTSDYLCDM